VITLLSRPRSGRASPRFQGTIRWWFINGVVYYTDAGSLLYLYTTGLPGSLSAGGRFLHPSRLFNPSAVVVQPERRGFEETFTINVPNDRGGYTPGLS